MNNQNQTAGEECRQYAQILNMFTNKVQPELIGECLGIAICKGTNGVVLVKLGEKDWSAPCAFCLHSSNSSISSNQETLILFLSD